LGTGDEATYKDDVRNNGSAKPKDDDDVPPPALDPSLTEDERAQIRADRAAAAEARLKKMGGTTKKKKKVNPDAPLVGPNSQPAMRWNMSG
jgi:hypothetical protein